MFTRARTGVLNILHGIHQNRAFVDITGKKVRNWISTTFLLKKVM